MRTLSHDPFVNFGTAKRAENKLAERTGPKNVDGDNVRLLSRRLDRSDWVIQNESGYPNGGNICVCFQRRRVRHNAITFLTRKSLKWNIME